jgi:hypothetical protein
MVMECQHVGEQSQMVEVEGETKRCGQNQQCEMGDDGIRCVCVENFMKVGKKCKGRAFLCHLIYINNMSHCIPFSVSCSFQSIFLQSFINM